MCPFCTLTAFLTKLGLVTPHLKRCITEFLSKQVFRSITFLFRVPEQVKRTCPIVFSQENPLFF